MPATAATSATTSLSLRAWEKNCIIGLGPGSILFLGSAVPLLGLVCAMVPKLAVQSSAPIPVVFPPCTVGSARDFVRSRTGDRRCRCLHLLELLAQACFGSRVTILLPAA